MLERSVSSTSASVSAIAVINSVNLNAIGANVVAGFYSQADIAKVFMGAYGSSKTGTRWGLSLAALTEVRQVGGTALAVGTTTAVSLILGTNGLNRVEVDGAGNVDVKTGSLKFGGGTVIAPTEAANTALMGPASGAAALPAFRAFVSADIPNNAADTSGTAGNTTKVNGASVPASAPLLGSNGAGQLVAGALASATVAATNQSATYGPANLQVNGAIAPAGLYRITFYAATRTAGAGNIIITITWTDSVGAKSTPAAILTLAAGAFVGAAVELYTSGAANITVTAAYTPTGAYDFYVSLERL